jgi:hypothetical protein
MLFVFQILLVPGQHPCFNDVVQADSLAIFTVCYLSLYRRFEMKIERIIILSIIFGLLLMGIGLAPNAAFAQSANLALNKPATASSIEGAGFEASKAVDGNTSTRWASVDPATTVQWIYVDLGSATALNRVVLKWEAAYAKSYQVQVSNDANTWTTIFSTTTGNGATDDLTGLSGSGRYVRVYATVRGTSYGYSLWEFEVYGSGGPTYTPTKTNTPTRTPTNTATLPPSTNLALNRPATASSMEGSGFEAAKAVDGNLSTRWASVEPATSAQWMYVDLGNAASINRVVLKWETAYAKSYQVQVSNDASTWTSIFSTITGNGATDDLTGLSGSGRYVRVYATVRGTSYGYSLWEFEVYGAGGPTLTPTATSYTLTPTNTPTRTATPTFTQPPSGKVQWTGVRSSRYGISPFPDACGWTNAMTTMSGYFPGSTPTSLWLTGEIFFNGTNSGQDLNFPNPGGTWDSRIHFASSDQNESYLTYFDTHGIKVFLQFEPGYAPLDQLFQVTYNRYGHHPSVIGFGVDVEWYQSQCDGCANVPVPDSTAQAWENKVKSLNPNYRLFLKHYDSAQLPPSYRGNIIFVNDSEQNGSYNNFLNEMINFADTFYPADVMYQIGYPSDKPWWSTLANPIPKTMGDELARRTQQNHMGIIWVDFSLRDVLPSTCP